MGGGLYNCSQVFQNYIVNNYAERMGAGIYDSGLWSDALIVNNVIHANFNLPGGGAETNGAGIHIAASQRGQVLFYKLFRCILGLWRDRCV